MIQRIALLIGGLGAATVLAFALGLVNFAFLSSSNTAANANTATQTTNAQSNGGNAAGSQAQQQTKTVVSKVYVAPSPKVSNGTAARSPRQNASPTRAPAPAWGGSDDGYPSGGGRHGGDN